MAPPRAIRHFLPHLSEIERASRRRFSDNSFLYLQNVTHESVHYFRSILASNPHLVGTPALDALHFYFEEFLLDVFRSRANFSYLAFEVDGQSSWPANHVAGRYSGWVSS